MFNRYLIMKNNKQEFLYLYINNYTEFSNDFNSNIKKNFDIKKIIKDYIRDKHIKFNGTKVFLVVSGVVISYIVLNNIPINKEWISDFEPIDNYDNDLEEIEELITKEININDYNN